MRIAWTLNVTSDFSGTSAVENSTKFVCGQPFFEEAQGY